MKLKILIEKLETFAPSKLAPFDKNQLLGGNINQEIKKICIALDFSMYSIEKALEKNCDLLIVHNLSEELKSINEKRFSKAQQNKLAIYKMHLPLDFTHNGIIHTLSKLLGFDAKPAITVYKGCKIKGGVYIAKTNMNFSQLIDRIKLLNPSNIRIFGQKKKVYKKIAISSGTSFKPEFLLQLRPDVYIAGQVSERESVVISEELGITLIELTHLITENYPLELITRRIKNLLGVETEFIDMPNSLEVVS